MKVAQHGHFFKSSFYWDLLILRTSMLQNFSNKKFKALYYIFVKSYGPRKYAIFFCMASILFVPTVKEIMYTEKKKLCLEK
jgi:hypothetical protein